MRTIGYAGWVVIVAVFLIWQGLALVYAPTWPTLSEIFRTAMRPPIGRAVLFGIWLWLGWHVFFRGWTFFLRT
jgi:Family of unknown function (DUF6186)